MVNTPIRAQTEPTTIPRYVLGTCNELGWFQYLKNLVEWVVASHQISESDSTDSDDCPPQSNGNRIELIIRILNQSFCVVNESSKDNNSQKNEEYEKK